MIAESVLAKLAAETLHCPPEVAWREIIGALAAAGITSGRGIAGQKVWDERQKLLLQLQLLKGANRAVRQPSEQLSHTREAPTLRGRPEPPEGLAEFERHVRASTQPAVVLIDRAMVRALLRYVRRLEAFYQ